MPSRFISADTELPEKECASFPMAPSKGLDLTDKPSLCHLAMPEAVVVIRPITPGARRLGQGIDGREKGSALIGRDG